MRIAVQPLVLRGPSQTPRHFESTLYDFFVLDAHRYQENAEFRFDREGREGGCQFAFDRDQTQPIRCINCKQDFCSCPADMPNKPRYALQRFTETAICILDLDLSSRVALLRNNWPEEKRQGWCKYWSLTWEEEELLREMEQKLMQLPGICFFYRTKCNGFRVAFEYLEPARDLESFAERHDQAIDIVRDCTPDGKLSGNQDAWLYVDDVGRNGQAFWSYPRVCNPIWLNPNRIYK